MTVIVAGLFEAGPREAAGVTDPSYSFRSTVLRGHGGETAKKLRDFLLEVGDVSGASRSRNRGRANTRRCRATPENRFHHRPMLGRLHGDDAVGRFEIGLGHGQRRPQVFGPGNAAAARLADV